MTSPELLKALDAAYRFDGDDARWLAGVAEALRPALDVGCGIHAFFVERGADPAGLIAPSRPVAVGLTPDWEATWLDDWWRAFMLTTSPHTLHAMLTHSVLNHSVDLWRALSDAFPTFGPHLESHAAVAAPEPPRGVMRYPDSLNFCALDANVGGVIFAANRPTTDNAPVSRPMARTLSQLATHIAAAHRLRQKRPESRALDQAEVLIDRDHKVVHATGDARERSALEAIRQAAVAVSRARPDEPGGHVASEDEGGAIAAWRSLTAGRWTVVDQFDRDGRRYFLARSNPPEPEPSAELSAREQQVLGALALGHSNKLIAYELGLHPSTVSNHLASVAKKLGVTSRVALVGRARRAYGRRP